MHYKLDETIAIPAYSTLSEIDFSLPFLTVHAWSQL